MKKIIITCVVGLAIIVAFIFAGGSLSGDDLSPKDENEIKSSIYIAILKNDDEKVSAAGNQETLGYYYANSVKPTVTLDEKEYTLRFIEIDSITPDMITPETTTSSAKLVINNRTISAVLVADGAEFNSETAGQLSSAGIVALGAYGTRALALSGTANVYSTCQTEDFQSSTAANYAYGKGYDDAAVVVLVGDAYSRKLADGFTTEFQRLGGRVTEFSYNTAMKNFENLSQKIMYSDADMVFMSGNAEFAGIFVKQARAKGLELPIFGGGSWDTVTLIEELYGIDKVFFASAFDGTDSDIKTSAEFGAKYKSWVLSSNERKTQNGNSSYASPFSALGYDAYMIISEAITQTQSKDSKSIGAYISTCTYEGVSGKISFGGDDSTSSKIAYMKRIVPFTDMPEVIQKSSSGKS